MKGRAFSPKNRERPKSARFHRLLPKLLVFFVGPSLTPLICCAPPGVKPGGPSRGLRATEAGSWGQSREAMTEGAMEARGSSPTFQSSNFHGAARWATQGASWSSVCLSAQTPGHWQTAASSSKENRVFPSGRTPFLPPADIWGRHCSRRQRCPGLLDSVGDFQACWGDCQRTTDGPQTGNNRF